MPGVSVAIFIPRTARGPGGDARQLGLKGHVEKKSPASDLRGGRTLSISGELVDETGELFRLSHVDGEASEVEEPPREAVPVLCRLNQVP